jgi:hypothetical protein
VRRTRYLLALTAATVAGLAVAAPGYAAGETFKVLKVNTTGCNSGNFGMTVERANLDGGSYTVRTVARAGGKIYMNENASISVNGESGWNLFNNFTYGAVPNPGTWPIPQNTQLRLDFTIERPMGTILWGWTTVVHGCNTGTILYNGTTSADKDKDLIPVPTDKCPKIKATTANGCPARSLTIAYDGAGHRFIGWLYAKGFPSLFARRAVTIWKVRPGADLRVARTRTTSRGNYAVARAHIAGRYYAVSGAIGAVPKETSLTLRLR